MKLKTYVLMLAKQFPAHHIMKGHPTDFYQKSQEGEKIHTIRINTLLWAKRIDEVNAGRAIISIRGWTERPYKSSQKELFQMHRCGYELVEKNSKGYIVHSSNKDNLRVEVVSMKDISKNDGLMLNYFKSWFAKIETDEPLIIIHFTDFRYTNNHPFGIESYLIPTQN